MSTINEEVTRIKSNISSAFTAVANKGGTNYTTANRKSANIATAINTIPLTGPDTQRTITAYFADLPDGYKEVQYIDFPSGSSDVQTNISLSSNPYFEYKSSLSFPLSIGDPYLPYMSNGFYKYDVYAGIYTRSITTSYRIEIRRLGSSSSTLGIRWGGGVGYFDRVIGTGIRGGVVSFDSFEPTGSSSYNARITYGSNKYNGIQGGTLESRYQLMYPTLESDSSEFTKRVYYFRTFDSSGNCTHNLVPCKTDTNVPGLYDIIARRLYVSTKYVDGPDVVPFVAGPEV